MAETTPPPRTMSLADLNAADSANQVAATIEEDIVFGRLHPGQRLVEQEIALQLQTNRNIVRRALGVLEAAGLVERIRNRGASVRDLKPHEVEQLYALRERLELMAIEQIRFPVAAADLSRIASLMRRHEEAAAQCDMRAVFRVNIEFHARIFALCGNPFLMTAIEAAARTARGIRSYSNTDTARLNQILREHIELHDALEAADLERLMALTYDHLQPSKRVYIEAYRRRFPEYRAPEYRAPEDGSARIVRTAEETTPEPGETPNA